MGTASREDSSWVGASKRWAWDPELGIAFCTHFLPGNSFQRHFANHLQQRHIPFYFKHSFCHLIPPLSLVNHTPQKLTVPLPPGSRANRYHEILRAFYSNCVSPPIHIRLRHFDRLQPHTSGQEKLRFLKTRRTAFGSVERWGSTALCVQHYLDSRRLSTSEEEQWNSKGRSMSCRNTR